MTTIDIELLYATLFPATPLSLSPENPICDLLDDLGDLDHLLLNEVLRVAEGGGSSQEWLQQILLNSVGEYADGFVTAVENTRFWLKVHLQATAFLSRVMLGDSVVETNAPYLSYTATKFLEVAKVKDPTTDESVAATVIAYVVEQSQDRYGNPTAIEEVWITQSIAYVAAHVLEIEPIVPELRMRKTCDQGVIIALLNEATIPMRSGAL